MPVIAIAILDKSTVMMDRASGYAHTSDRNGGHSGLYCLHNVRLCQASRSLWWTECAAMPSITIAMMRIAIAMVNISGRYANHSVRYDRHSDCYDRHAGGYVHHNERYGEHCNRYGEHRMRLCPS